MGLAGACETQLKFSELTLDIFRMLLTVEAPPAPDSSTARQNPHKHLLYLPSMGQLNVVLASICKDLPEHAAVMLYVSADQYVPSQEDANATMVTASAPLTNGVMLSTRSAGEPSAPGASVGYGLYPHDVMAFTRRPFVLVADSPGSGAFLELKNVFGAPLLCLLSPTKCPGDIKGPTMVGNLFTLFLHAPLHAFWVTLKQEKQLEKDEFDRAEGMLTHTLDIIHEQLIAAGPALDESIKLFMTDDLICNMILRLVFFQAVASLHTSFKGDAQCMPMSNPALPEGVAQDEAVLNSIVQLAEVLVGSAELSKEFISRE